MSPAVPRLPNSAAPRPRSSTARLSPFRPEHSSATNGGSTTRWGWTVGGGIEWAFSQNWSVAGEYRYTDFGNRATTFTIPDGFGSMFATGTSSNRLTVEQATARLNYRFGGPVVARY